MFGQVAYLTPLLESQAAIKIGEGMKKTYKQRESFLELGDLLLGE
jgi:hypothetical protein